MRIPAKASFVDSSAHSGAHSVTALFVRMALAGVVVLAGTQMALAYGSGISGRSGNPATNQGRYCSTCHAGGVLPTVAVVGPTSVAPGSTNSYEFRITGGQRIAGGLDVSVTSGSLTASDPGTYLNLGEVTHSAPRPAINDVVSFVFSWTAPPTPGAATIYAAGNSVNFDGDRSGDAAEKTSLAVTITAAATTPGEASRKSLPQLKVDSYNKLTGNMSLSYGPACAATNHNIQFGPLTAVSTYGWSGSTCAIGTSGAFGSFNPGVGSWFFVVTGVNATSEGSYGVRSNGVVTTERPPNASSICGQSQQLANRCDATP